MECNGLPDWDKETESGQDSANNDKQMECQLILESGHITDIFKIKGIVITNCALEAHESF